MGCTSSKSAGGSLVVSSSNHLLAKHDPAKPGAAAKPRPGDFKGLKPPDKLGGVKRAISTTTACTVTTGGTGCSSNPCCAETHPCDLSSHHGSEHGDSDEEVVDESRRESLTVDDVFRAESDGNDGGDDGGEARDSKRGLPRDGSYRNSNAAEVLSSANGVDLPKEFLHIDLPHDKPIDEVYSGVRDGPILGEGVCGTVRQITHRLTGSKFAVKRLDLSLVTTDDELRRLREEIYIMCQLDHPNIVKLEEVYESPHEIFLVGELLDGGELFDRLDEQPDYHYTEAECARLIAQMLQAVRYIHSKGIVHRDLKLENFLFESRRPNAQLKMIDFGLSKHFNVGDVQCEIVGTPYTVAPEVVRGRYDERCDVWGVGVLAFFLLSGDPPFGGCGGPEPLNEVRDNILAGRYNFEPGDIWDEVSEDAKDFVRALLVTDPARRPTTAEAQGLRWLRRYRRGNMDKSQSELTKMEVANAIKKSRSGDALCHLGNLSLIHLESATR